MEIDGDELFDRLQEINIVCEVIRDKLGDLYKECGIEHNDCMALMNYLDEIEKIINR
jgi:hypothetical protein